MQRVRVGFIGLGGIATRSHLPALRLLPGVTVTAGAEVNAYQAERTQRRFGIPTVYPTYREMMEREELDAVYVCLPSFLHYEAASAGLDRGLHVYCEKPMGLYAREAMALVAEAERRGLVLVPGYNLRFHPAFGRARQLLAEKRLGKILQVHAIAAKPGPYVGWDPKSDWYFDKRNLGVLYDQGSHVMDLLFYVTGLEVEDVQATSGRSMPGLTVPDNISSIFRCRNGVVGTLSLAWAAPGNMTMLQIHGTAGSVLVSDGYFEYRTAQGGGVERLGDLLGNSRAVLARALGSLISRQAVDNTYVQSSLNFLQAVRGTALPRQSARDATRVLEVLEGLAEALRRPDLQQQQEVAA